MMEANDFAWYERDRVEYEHEQDCPVCDECGEAITDSDEFYMVYGNCICEQCMDSMKMRVDDYIKERETA